MCTQDETVHEPPVIDHVIPSPFPLISLSKNHHPRTTEQLRELEKLVGKKATSKQKENA